MLHVKWKCCQVFFNQYEVLILQASFHTDISTVNIDIDLLGWKLDMVFGLQMLSSFLWSICSIIALKMIHCVEQFSQGFN